MKLSNSVGCRDYCHSSMGELLKYAENVYLMLISAFFQLEYNYILTK